MPRSVVPSILVLALALMLAACSSSPLRNETGASTPPPRQTGAVPPATGAARPGGYYKDDGPGANPPDLDRIADAQPQPEKLLRAANNPYQVFGQEYVPLRSLGTYRERGIASWYGRRYHGQKTSSGEIYDMYAMTAAHPTLPIPSYARVTNLANGRSVVVRVNDRGPFLSNRIIDLSYVAAYKLGYIQAGSAQVEVESLRPDGSTLAAAPVPAPVAAPVAVSAPSSVPAAAAQSPAPAAAAVVAPPPTDVATRPAPALPLSREAGGVYLQLGAFSMRDNAEAFRVRVYRELPWLNDAIELSGQGGLFRLKLGPYRTQDDARRVGGRIQAELNLKPVLVVR